MSIAEQKVSIIIPHYNNARYLDDCLNSIRNQTYDNVEVIVVDDCSKRNETIKAALITCRYGYFFLKNSINKGVSFTRNYGLSKATGSILTTIDPDDFFVSSNYIEVLVKSIQNAPQTVAGGVAVYYNENKTLLSKRVTKSVLSGDLKCLLFSRTCFIPINIFYTTAMLAKVKGYNSKFDSYEDWDFKLRLSFHFNFHIQPVEIGYRIHNEGLSSISRRKKIFSLSRIFIRNFIYLDRGSMFRVLLLILGSFFEKYRSIYAQNKF